MIPENTCICGDSVSWMAKQSTTFADLIIADPPFNIKWEYDSYNDNMSDSEYLSWAQTWISHAYRLLNNDGNLLICVGDEYVSDIDHICRHKLKIKRAEWLIWNYTFGQSGKLDTRKKFTRSKTHILRFIKSQKPYFNASAVAVPSGRQLKYSDKRADPRGKCPDDVFIFKRIAGTHKERVKSVKTQMPIDLLKVWIKAMCKPNGLVFDPFPGSGSSLIAAKSLNRKYLGVELSENYTNIILSRLT